MTALLEIREKLKDIYSKNEMFILPVVKFILAFIVFGTLNKEMGYMAKIDKLPIELVASLLCSFLPNGFLLFLGSIFSILHMYAMSLEVAVVGLCIYLLMFFMFFRFSPRDSLAVVFTAMACAIKVPYIMPIAMGLIGTPLSAISVGCGVLVYHLLNTVIASAPTISTMDAAEATAKVRLIIDNLLANKAILVMIVSFAITVIAVYFLRRMSTDYAWTIAIIAGAMINLIVLLLGDLLYDTNMSVLTAVLGSVAAIIVAKIIEFFRFCVDYSRTEKVQFEDDEYYYYVKAVPKMTVAAPTKTVKKINTQRQSVNSENTERRQGVPTRTVTTERTAAPKDMESGARGYGVRGAVPHKSEQPTTSRTIGSNNTVIEDLDDDIEELF